MTDDSKQTISAKTRCHDQYFSFKPNVNRLEAGTRLSISEWVKEVQSENGGMIERWKEKQK